MGRRDLTRPFRRLLQAVWNQLPPALHEPLIYLLAPKVTLGVCAVIVDDAGRLLLVHHTHRHRGWDFPGGLLHRHEQPALAIAREVQEELGVGTTVGSVLYIDNAVQRRHITIFYRVWIDGPPHHDLETDAHRYVTLDELTHIKGPEAAQWIRLHVLAPLMPSPTER